MAPSDSGRSDHNSSPTSQTSDGTDRLNARNRARLIFCLVVGVVIVSLTWPGFTLFSSAEPILVGLPLPFAWTVICTLIVFSALLYLYRTDHPGEGRD